MDAKTCFIDSLMTCCVFLACKIYEINTFNFSEIISVCSKDSFGNSNPKTPIFQVGTKVLWNITQKWQRYNCLISKFNHWFVNNDSTLLYLFSCIHTLLYPWIWLSINYEVNIVLNIKRTLKDNSYEMHCMKCIRIGS